MILKIDNINVFYGNIHALRDVSLEVNEGEIVALIGANGAGKSTTLKTVSGLLRSETGSISFLEQDISKEYPHKLVSRGLAHVPEGRHIFQELSVLANLELGAYTCGKVSSKDLENVYTHFPRLKERRNQTAGTLSGGEQQRVSIARALAKNPKILLCDEPTGALDYNTSKEILKLIENVNKKYGNTVIMVTHNDAIKNMADKVIKLKDGKIRDSFENKNKVSASDLDW